MSCVCGASHTILLSDEGVVHCFGCNYDGQLGLGLKDISIRKPMEIQNLPRITYVSCGAHYTVCIDGEGCMWSFGKNNYGQLGTGHQKGFNTPQKIKDIPPVFSVSCGYGHTLALTDNLNLWSAGRNSSGQLCLNNGTTDQKIFQQTSYSNVSVISAGGDFSLFQSGEIYGCGYNCNGQLGLGHVFITPTVTRFPNLPSNIIQFACGKQVSVFIDNEGKVFYVGRINDFNYTLQLRQIPNIPPIKNFSCGANNCYLLDEDGEIWYINERATNVTQQIPRANPIALKTRQISKGHTSSHFLIKSSQNEIIVLGKNDHGQILSSSKNVNRIETLSNVELSAMWGEPSSPIIRAKSARK